ncbi:hypothetical protein V6N11_044226 [Hibiscus sabdariffa]|uniref:Uncharacterized protein n=1 Tax=Hibiscus sabdariffa TaxID=183260 RepID=A0ABR2REX5_9ROSI
MPPNGGSVEGHHPGFSRKASESSFCPTEDEDDDDDEEREIELGPKCTLREQLEKDKCLVCFFSLNLRIHDDENLRKWKDQLLRTVNFDSVEEKLELDVKIVSLAIKSPGRPDIILKISENGKPKGSRFTLKEGNGYSLKFTFQVIDSMKEMMGTFSFQADPYTHEISEETNPSEMFARGSYSARTKFVDDNK